MSIIEHRFRSATKSQYHAALDMMHHCIKECSVDLWTSPHFVNPYWRIVYHTLFYFRLYLHQDLDDHVHWERHRKGAQNLTLDPNATEVEPYSKKNMSDFVEHCHMMVDDAVDHMDLTRDDCGFYWYKVAKLEHMMVNLRHLQHHIAQLQDRLRNVENVGVKWVRAQDQIKT